MKVPGNVNDTAAPSLIKIWASLSASSFGLGFVFVESPALFGEPLLQEWGPSSYSFLISEFVAGPSFEYC